MDINAYLRKEFPHFDDENIIYYEYLINDIIKTLTIHDIEDFQSISFVNKGDDLFCHITFKGDLYINEVHDLEELLSNYEGILSPIFILQTGYVTQITLNIEI